MRSLKPILLIVSFTCVSSFVDPPPSKIYPTCDLDLSPEALEELSDECKNLDAELREKLLAEADKFRQFTELLEQYEDMMDPEYSPNGLKPIPDKQWQVRYEIYDTVDWYTCYQNGAAGATEPPTYTEFIDCLYGKRLQMIEEINERLGRLKQEQGASIGSH